MSAIPRSRATSLAMPPTMTCGCPDSSVRTSMSVHEMPRLQPVPMALRIASLAAHRPAKCSIACFLDWQ